MFLNAIIFRVLPGSKGLKMRIKTKITGMGLFLVILTAASIVGIALHQKTVLKRNINHEVDLLVRSEVQKVAQNVYLMCRTMQESLEKMLSNGLKVVSAVAGRSEGLDFNGPPVAWEVRNQTTLSQKQVVLPQVLYQKNWLGKNRDFDQFNIIVDEVAEKLGVTCTIFQRMNEAGDMLRVATNVPDSEGNRAIGTYIPRHNPDGSSNPVIDALLKGEVYTGRAYVVNDWYLTGYKPLFDDSGSRVVGALYVGQRQDSITSLRRGILDIVIGKNGYVAVVGGQGKQRGHYIISRDEHRDGENLLLAQDVGQREEVQKILQQALALKKQSGSRIIPVATQHYLWKNPGDPEPRKKIAAITYFEPWDWVVLASAYEEDYEPARQHMASALSEMIGWISGVALVLVLVSLLIGFYVARGIVRPLESAMLVFERIGRGQLDLQLNVTKQDEIGQLSRNFNRMVLNLKEVTASRDELNRQIIERMRVEKALRETSAKREDLERIVNNSPAVAFLWSAETGWPVEYVTLNISQFGFDAEDFWKGRLLFSSVVHEEDLEQVQKAVAHHCVSPEGGSLTLEYRIINRRGEIFWIENRLWLRRDDDDKVTHYQGVVLDITARKKAEQEIHRMAYYDALTGLPNRSLLMNRLEQALAQAGRDQRLAALLFFDLDRFKEVNDQYGHDVGDKLLSAVGLRLASCIRQNDTLARFGGDEFIILIPGVENENALKTVADKILASMAKPFCIDQHRFEISISIGISLYPEHGQDPDLLLKRADTAMYAAKEKGRKGYCFFDVRMEDNHQSGSQGLPDDLSPLLPLDVPD